ncbi:MAG: queuosine salvage family protein [Phycisphaerae bacterium]|nr:queuosine salvage family protein [Phycisphaerae bacterium]
MSDGLTGDEDVVGAARFDVRGACRWVIERADCIQIDTGAIERWAKHVSLHEIRPAPRPATLRFLGRPADVARWILLIDCLNFFFWSQTGPLWTVEYEGRPWQRYFALVAALRRAVARHPSWLTAERWASATAKDCAAVFAGDGHIPLLEERTRILNETGRVLLNRFDGEAIHLAEEARFDAVRVAAAVSEAFPSFRDVHGYKGRQIPILKRAQIFASDLAAGFEENQTTPIANLAGLTAFADYRLPQTLRHFGVMVLAAELESRIESEQLVRSGSPEEIELRAGTVRAVDLMVEALRRMRRADLPCWLVDEYLWDHSHDPDVIVRHHRTVTHYY